MMHQIYSLIVYLVIFIFITLFLPLHYTDLIHYLMKLIIDSIVLLSNFFSLYAFHVRLSFIMSIISLFIHGLSGKALYCLCSHQCNCFLKICPLGLKIICRNQ